MNGFEKRAAMIREKIMTAALELMRSTEPKRIRIADLAKAAEVSQVSIYNHFGSKEALFREVFKGYLDKFSRQYEAMLQEKLPMREMVERIFAMERESFDYFPPHLMKELLLDDPELALVVERQYTEQTLPLTIGMLQDWKDRGEISDAVEVEHVLAFMQLFKLQNDLILRMAEQSGDMEKFLDGIAHLFFYGISGKP